MRTALRTTLAGALMMASSMTIAAAMPSGSVHAAKVAAGTSLRVHVAAAVGGKTVFGQLTVAQATDPGHVVAYACADGPPRDPNGQITKSDLNYNGHINPVTSNRLIVTADTNGDICFHVHTAVHLIVDINGVTDTGITPTPNQRTDTRNAGAGNGVPPA